MDVDEDEVLSSYMNIKISMYRCMDVDGDGVLSMYMNIKIFMYRCMDVDGVLSLYMNNIYVQVYGCRWRWCTIYVRARIFL